MRFCKTAAHFDLLRSIDLLMQLQEGGGVSMAKPLAEGFPGVRSADGIEAVTWDARRLVSSVAARHEHPQSYRACHSLKRRI